jgi:protein-disulfide isomerase
MTLVALFAYKTFVNPEIVMADVKSAATEAADIKTEVPADIENIIKNYILNHPEDIIQSLEGLQQKKIEESSKKTEDYLKNNKAEIETAGTPPVMGSVDGNITIVMFYDYNCSFCKKGNEYLSQMLELQKGVKVVLRPIPILGGTSMYAAKVAIATQKISPEKFPAIHAGLMQISQPITEAAVKELIAKNNIDYAVVENEINSYSTRDLINKNLEMAQNIGIKGAPSYVIDGQFVPGLLDLDKLKRIVAELKGSK